MFKATFSFDVLVQLKQLIVLNVNCMHMRVVYHVDSLYYFCTVSAQTSCVISPDLDMLTINDGLRRDVELHCQCMNDNGIVSGTRWFLPNTSVVSTDSSNRPYSTGTAPSRLIIASPFTSADMGAYTCSPDCSFPPQDSITLNAAGKYVSCCFIES